MSSRSRIAAIATLAALCTAAEAAGPETDAAPSAKTPQASAADTSQPAAPEAPKVEYAILAEFVEEDSLSPLRYLSDGSVTVNDRCPVRLVRLNRRMEPVYVNGRAVGFC
jgi:hypothetical protein